MTDSADAVIGFYRRHAGDFDAERLRSQFEKAWLDRFAALVPENGAILDLGCGMGEPIAQYFVARGYRITGVDSSPEMIDRCRARFPGQTWQVADMRALALSSEFDGVLAWDSFFHLTRDDQRAMFPVFRDHARPGAPLMFTSGPGDGEAVGELWGEPLYHASLASGEYLSLLARHDFGLVRHVAEDPDCGRRTVWLARRNGAR
jgi:SAM-dependent methyltransferase